MIQIVTTLKQEQDFSGDLLKKDTVQMPFESNIVCKKSTWIDGTISILSYRARSVSPEKGSNDTFRLCITSLRSK
jgi:hypothetical protein